MLSITFKHLWHLAWIYLCFAQCVLVPEIPFLARLYEVKESLCDIPRAHPRALACVAACVHDQNVQFLRLGQFLSNCKG